MRVLPKHHYAPGGLRCVVPTCDNTGEIGLGFDAADGTVSRVRLSLAHAALLLAALLDDQRVVAACQALSSSGSPSVDGSVVPGQSQ
jgi:hypothetical protein